MFVANLKGVEEQFKDVHHELGAQLSSITNLRSMIESGGVGMGMGAGKPIGKCLADGLYSHHISKLADYASLAGGDFIEVRGHFCPITICPTTFLPSLVPYDWYCSL